jgi:PAS domain S-box-containing protein
MAESIVESSTEAVLNVARTERIRVLHVDDDQAFLKVAKQCLEMQGPFQVDMASSVEEAMEKMKKEAYDAVVSDYQMPEKDGLQFLEELRQKGNSIPFIVFTGKGREEVVIKALNMGADHYENKNGDPETVYSELSHDIINAVKTRRAEQELRIQREELQVILDSMPAKIWYKDRNNRLVRVNKAFAEYMGVSKENLEGKPLCDLFPPDIAQKCWEEDKEVFTTGQPKTDILDRHESAQGVRWFSTGKVPCREKDGNIIGTINFSVDITERKQAEEALRQSEVRYRELTESISDMFFAMDKNFRYTYWNKASEKLTGISAKDAIGKSLTEVFPDVKGTRVEQLYEEALRTQQPQSYLNKYQLEGKDYVFELNAYPTETGLSVFVKDVTEREKMDETLKSSEQKFRGLVEDSAAAIATIDLKGRLIYVNKALVDSLGYSVQEMSGRAFKDFVHPDDRGRLVRLFLKIIVLRRKPRKFEFRALRKDGAILHLTCRPTRLETAGKTVGFQAIIIDNTAEKRMLEKAEKTSEKLSVVGGLTRHDVNNKLSTILNVSHLLKQKLRDNQSLELVKETESAVHQIEGLFEFARTYEKLGTEELAYVDAEKVFNEAARLFPSLKDIRIVNDCHGLTLFADSLLRQLFYNLIDNSLKHGEKVDQVRVHYEISEDHLKLIYDDDGIGIPKAEKDKIFKEGYGKARGHGLYLIKKMCEVYGWTIQETGKQGKGTQFTINMPKAKPDGKPPIISASHSPPTADAQRNP